MKGISLSTLLRDKVKEVRTVSAGVRQIWSRTYVQEALVGRSMEAPGAWAHERPAGAHVVRTGCSICQRGASLKIKLRALPPPGTGKARHLWTHTTIQFNPCCLFMGGELARSPKDSRAGFRDDLLTGILSLLCHKGSHTTSRINTSNTLLFKSLKSVRIFFTYPH